MTHLLELYRDNRLLCKRKIEHMDTSLLFAELDDTIQLDICHSSNEEWIYGNKTKDTKIYNLIVKELKDRILRLEKENKELKEKLSK